MEDYLTYEELYEWAAYFRFEEKTHSKIEYYFAQLTYFIVALWSSKGKNKSPKDYLLNFEEDSKDKKPWKEWMSRMKTWALMHNEKIRQERKRREEIKRRRLKKGK